MAMAMATDGGAGSGGGRGGGISLVARRTIRASAPRLFAAWTEPELLKQWWGPPGVTCTAAEIELRPGGRYRIANRLPGGEVLWIAGTFEEVSPPERLVYSWSLEPPRPAPDGGPGTPEHSRVTVQFRPRGRDTEVIVVHENIADAAIRADHEAGWTGCLDGLAALFGAWPD
jgi:uncharacterized protein YndB with AHSA1/START domain